MEVKPGYKQTEIGVIPIDWDVNRLSEYVDITSSRRIFESDYCKDGIPFYRGKEISQLIDCLVLDDLCYISEDKYDQISKSYGIPMAGDILITAVGTLGNVYSVPSDSRFYFKDGNLIWLRRTHNIEPLYLALQIKFNKQRLINSSIGSSQRALTIIVVSKFEVPIPSLHEQVDIMHVINDMVSLITALDKLTAKKKLIKQGAMQELLTGKRRLPGFTGEWETKSYGDVFRFLKTASYSREDLSNSQEIKYIHYGDVHTKWNHWLDFAKAILPSINNKQLRNYSLIKDGDVVMVDASEDYSGIGKSVEILNVGQIKAIAGLHTFLLRDIEKTYVKGFRGYLHSIKSVKEQFDLLATGMKVYGVNKTNLKKVLILVPPKEEQIAINRIISDMDTEINALEQKLYKYKQIKQGMMQELLTGRIRLI